VNINLNATLDQEVSDGQHAALKTLDAQMSASGYASDHPWRRQLSSVIAAPVAAGPDIEDEIDLITLSTETLNGLLSLALRVCADAGNVDNATAALLAARRYVEDINDYVGRVTQLTQGAAA
jgi:hypothetical protein